jgi:predicted AAA+ superfamily ATPase
MHLVVTGSNSKLLFSDLATHLTGRFIQIELTPFTFAEYRRYLCREGSSGTEWRAEARRDYETYFRNGGFPETLRISDKRGYFKALYDSILVRDVLRRHKVRSPKLLSDVAFIAMSNYGSEISALNLSNQLSAASATTIQNYLHFIEESRLVDLVPRFGRKAWEKTRLGKVYGADMGLLSYFTGSVSSEDGLGRRLENLVYLQLRSMRDAQDFTISYLRESDSEVDFLVERRGREYTLIQVSYDISSPKTRARELSALFSAGEKLGCDDLVLVTDHEDGTETDGRRTVKIVNIVDWLLKEGNTP